MATLKREIKKLPSEQNLRLLSSLIISLANKVDSTSEKCINPFTPNTAYAKGSYVTHDNYIYESKIACNDADWVESHWVRLSDTIDELSVEDVKAFLNLSPQEISKLSDLISTEIRLDKTFSSSDTYMRIQAAIDTAKEYTNNQLGKAVKPAYKVVTNTSEVTETGYFYLISNGTNFDMYVLSSDGSVVSLGTSEVDLSNYYTKTETDSDFLKKTDATSTYATITTVDGKVDKTNILTTTSTTATDDQVYSAKVMNTELNGVVKKTDISTAIDGTSTNDTVPTNKAVYDGLLNKVNNTIVLTTADEVNSFDRVYQSFIINPSVAEAVGLPKSPDSTWFCINLSHFKGFKYPSQIAFEYAGIERIMYRTAHNGVWHNWRKIPTTSVSDVPLTTVPLDSSKFSNGYLQYEVKNGMCYVYINTLNAKATFLGYDISSTPMPKPSSGLATTPIVSDSNGVNIGLFYVDASFNSTPRCHIFTTSLNGYVTFSYTVAES